MWRTYAIIAILCGCAGVQGGGSRRGCPSAAALPRDGAWVAEAEDCALLRAREAGVPALVYVTTEWCKPCRVLEEGTFAEPSVQDFLRGLVALKVDGSRENFAPVRARWEVNSYPTTILYGPDGVEIDRLLGVLGPSEFLARMRSWLAGRDTLEDLVRQAEAAPEDAELQLRAGRRLAKRGRGVEAARILERAVAAGPSLGAQRVVALSILGEQVYLDLLERHADARRILTLLAQEHPAAPYGPRAWMAMARMILVGGDREGAEAALVEHVRPDPERPMEVFRLANFALRHGIGEVYARDLAARAAPLSPDKAWLWKALADLERRRGDLPAALAALEEAVAAAPENRTYRSLLEAWAKGTVRSGRSMTPSERDSDDGAAPR